MGLKIGTISAVVVLLSAATAQANSTNTLAGVAVNSPATESSYISFNQNRRLGAYDGLSVDSDLGRMSLTDDISISGFSRVNDEEQQIGIGVNILGSHLTAMQGKGKGFSRMANQYADVDPYYFHGGTTAAYSFNALEWAHQFNSSLGVQFGTAAIESDHLEDRDTHYIGAQIGSFNGHMMQVRRGGVRVGETLSLGFDSPLGNFGLATLQQIAGGQMRQVSYHFDAGAATRYGFSFSSSKNPLLDEGQSYRVMLSFSRPIGRINSVSAAAEVEPESGEEVKRKRNRNIAVLGGAAVAAGLVISSGSDNQDRAIRLPDQHSAAREVLNDINPKSVRENREYGGWVYETPDGNYTSTKPIAGSIDSVEIPYSLIPSGGRPLATYHTHGGDDPRYLNEQFSGADIASDLAIGLDGYLGTPIGNFLWHDVRLNQIQSLGSITH